MRLFAELKRRKVFQTAVIYAAAAWLLLQVAQLLLEMFGVPAWGLKLVFVLLVIGFPLALILSWMHQLTPQGLRREVDPPPGEPAAHNPARTVDVARPGIPAPASAAAVVADNSIAVLPFANMSDDPANMHFADGLSEELLNLLSRIPGLRVVARTSSFSFRGRAVNAATIAQELKVSHLLEGSVRKAGNRIRITAQLIRGADSSHLWSEAFDRDLNDIFAVQDEIAAAVVDELEIKLLGGATPKSWPTDPDAYAHYLRARHDLELASKPGYEQAVAGIEAALADRSQVRSGLGAAGRRVLGGGEQFPDQLCGRRPPRTGLFRKGAGPGPESRRAPVTARLLDVLEGVDFDGGMRRVARARQLEPHNQRILSRLANVPSVAGRWTTFSATASRP